MSGLESLPRDVLIKILCLVSHHDLGRLCIVSKNIKEAAVIAKKLHFDYKTPRVPAFKKSLDLDSSREFADIQSPNAPLRHFRKRESRKNPPTGMVLFP